MISNDSNNKTERTPSNGTHQESQSSRRSMGKRVTEARAKAQRTKLDTQEQARKQQAEQAIVEEPKKRGGHQEQHARRRTKLTVEQGIEDYLHDHEGGNHSEKTLEWHRVSLGLMQTYLEQERKMTLVGEIDAPDISSWFASMRKVPGHHGKIRSERTIQTYARSARAFFHWLVRRETIVSNPMNRVTFPKVGKPLIQTITAEEFEKLLLACTPPNEAGPIAERASVRNRAIFWLLYDTGIRVSELCGLRLGDFDRRHALIVVKGKGSKERRITLGSNCLRNVLYYLDRHRPGEEELSEWGSAAEDHFFLTETRTPLTKNGVEMLFKRVREPSAAS